MRVSLSLSKFQRMEPGDKIDFLCYFFFFFFCSLIINVSDGSQEAITEGKIVRVIKLYFLAKIVVEERNWK